LATRFDGPGEALRVAAGEENVGPVAPLQFLDEARMHGAADICAVSSLQPAIPKPQTAKTGVACRLPASSAVIDRTSRPPSELT
jgi:hypothetical protein